MARHLLPLLALIALKPASAQIARRKHTNVYGGASCAKVATACVNYLNATSFVTVHTNASFPLGTFGIIRRVGRKPNLELRQI